MPLPNINTVSYNGELIKTLYFKYYQTHPTDYSLRHSTNSDFDRDKIESDYTNFRKYFLVNPDNSVAMPYDYICPYPYSAYYPVEKDNYDNSVIQYSGGTNYSLKNMKKLADNLTIALTGNPQYSDYSTILKNAFNEAKNYIPINSNLNNVDLTGLSIREVKPHIQNMLSLFTKIKNHKKFKSKNTPNGPYEKDDITRKYVTVTAVFDAVVVAFTSVLTAFDSVTIITIRQYTDYINNKTRELYQMSGSKVDVFKSQYIQTMILGAIMTIIMSALLYFVFSNIYNEGLGSSGNGSNVMSPTGSFIT